MQTEFSSTPNAYNCQYERIKRSSNFTFTQRPKRSSCETFESMGINLFFRTVIEFYPLFFKKMK